MKKGFLFFLLPVFVFLIPFSARGTAERKLTVMIYMCGSNLETLNGSASEDIEEMLDAGISGGEVSLLLMTGGAENWEAGFDSEEALIHEIGPRGRRIVRESEKMNMGSRNTLADFLRFGKENYPAENYALILWDHGGGPLDGVCWDELFSLDHLDLSEITRGIRDAGLRQKLSWIGFDACLMSSLEVAAALEPYAEYMIASQEAEPKSGWNYAFLSCIENDADGSVTGRRIVDSYFEGRGESADTLTLACVDLGKAAAAAAAMDTVFEPLADSVNEASYAKLANLRMAASGFGKGISALGDAGYDLVDAADLITRLDDGSAAELLRILRESVVYSRSNTDGANGLSLYHPYINKAMYLEKWRTDYEELKFSPGYTRYMKAFGTLLTGADPVDWRGLEILSGGQDKDGSESFHMGLTPEQLSNFASGKLLILKDISMGNDPEYALLTSISAVPDENGTLTASYDGHALYAETEDGSVWGPIAILQDPDADYKIVYAVYDTVNYFDIFSSSENVRKRTSAAFYLDADDDSEYPEIRRTRVFDDVTEQWTNRLSYSESDYRFLYFWDFARILPVITEKQPLPGFRGWDRDQSIVSTVLISLPDEWKLRSSRFMSDETLYAMFEVTDIRQNTYGSRPIKILNPVVRPFDVTSAPVETGKLRIGLSGEVLLRDKSLHLQITLTNLTDADLKASEEYDSFVLNGTRWIRGLRNPGPGMNKTLIPAGETVVHNLYIDARDLMYLSNIDTVSFEIGDARAEFSLRGCDVREIAPVENLLAEGKAEDLEARMLSAEYNPKGEYEILLYAKNSGAADYYLKTDPLLNGIQTKERSDLKMVPAGKDLVYLLRVSDVIRVLEPVFPGNDDSVLVENLLLSHGNSAVTDLRLFFAKDRFGGFGDVTEVRLRAAESGGREEIPAERPARMTAAENEQYRIDIDRIFVSGNHIVCALELANRTDRWIRLIPENAAVNDGKYPCGVTVYYIGRDLVLPPDSVKAEGLILEIEGNGPAEGPFRNFSLVFRGEDGAPDESLMISFDAPELSGGEEVIRLEPGNFSAGTGL